MHTIKENVAIPAARFEVGRRVVRNCGNSGPCDGSSRRLKRAAASSADFGGSVEGRMGSSPGTGALSGSGVWPSRRVR